jgi:hypothetical protein
MEGLPGDAGRRPKMSDRLFAWLERNRPALFAIVSGAEGIDFRPQAPRPPIAAIQSPCDQEVTTFAAWLDGVQPQDFAQPRQ